MKKFLLCKIEGDNLSHEIFSSREAIDFALRSIREGKASGNSRLDNQDLALWLPDAEVGEMFKHPLGIWVRLRDW